MAFMFSSPIINMIIPKNTNISMAVDTRFSLNMDKNPGKLTSSTFLSLFPTFFENLSASQKPSILECPNVKFPPLVKCWAGSTVRLEKTDQYTPSSTPIKRTICMS